MEYPEHEKLHAIKVESQIQGQFIEWLGENGMCIAYLDDETDQWMPTRMSTNQILAQHHGIDLNKLEAEKQAMLDEIRKVNA